MVTLLQIAATVVATATGEGVPAGEYRHLDFEMSNEGKQVKQLRGHHLPSTMTKGQHEQQRKLNRACESPTVLHAAQYEDTESGFIEIVSYDTCTSSYETMDRFQRTIPVGLGNPESGALAAVCSDEYYYWWPSTTPGNFWSTWYSFDTDICRLHKTSIFFYIKRLYEIVVACLSSFHRFIRSRSFVQRAIMSG